MNKPKNASQKVGRQFSKRIVTTAQIGGETYHFEEIDAGLLWGKKAIETHRKNARDCLENNGIDVDKLLVNSPHGSAVRDLVLNCMSNEPDSKVGLAARVFELCCHIQGYESMPGGESQIPSLAYRLGRLLDLQRVYDVESEMQASRRKGKGEITDAQKKRINSQYRSLVDAGEKYGAIKLLSGQHGVSASMIKLIIKSIRQ